uniref:Uncharacterized protein n=1 Tax=Oryza brachyantha TaxID=4533 RepID=J3L4S1_ORYBR
SFCYYSSGADPETISDKNEIFGVSFVSPFILKDYKNFSAMLSFRPSTGGVFCKLVYLISVLSVLVVIYYYLGHSKLVIWRKFYSFSHLLQRIVEGEFIIKEKR